MALKEYIALIATLLIVVSYIPQLIKGYTTKSMKDLSMGYLGILLAGIALWTWYGFLNDDMTFLIANTVIMVLTCSIIAMKVWYDRKGKHLNEN